MDLSNSSHRLGLIVALLIIVGVATAFVMNKKGTESVATEKTETASAKTDSAQDTTASTAQTPAPETAGSKAISGAVIKTNFGDIEVVFYGADAPKTVENFTKLASAKFYDSTKFHRVIKGFMIQGGDPFSKDDAQIGRWGTGGPGYQFGDEINSHKIMRGVLAMANGGPDTNGSQFFIVTAQATPWLDGHHTVFGKVVKGMDVIDKIENTPTGPNDVPKTPVVVESITFK